MAMMRYAKATLVRPHVDIDGRGWQEVRTAAKAQTGVNENLIERASGIFEATFKPKDYLLSHCTIVASVDTEDVPNAKMGSVLENGRRINRKFSDYWITPRTAKYLNNNGDGWSRQVLLKSYRTFIGAFSFVEHVQMEELSKGRIIDAVARDVGDSIYVDILVANDRKHRDLIEAIESGKMDTLSMGCTIDGSQCTKCGHWAADETEMCDCVKYSKLSTFYDPLGRQRVVGELCGHHTIDPTGGVRVIEGSWVGTPAFTGAVLRNVIEVTPALSQRAAAILAQPPEDWSPATYRKAAALAFAPDHFLAGWGDVEDDAAPVDDESSDAPDEPTSGPFDDLEEELSKHLKDRVRKKLKKDMDQKDIDDALGPEDSSAATNDNLVKQSRWMMDDLVPNVRQKHVYGSTVAFICRTASNDADMMDKVALLNMEYGVRIPVPLYRAALQLGSVSGYESSGQFVRACQAALGCKPTTAEANILFRLGKLISLRGQARGECSQDSTLAVAITKEKMR